MRVLRAIVLLLVVLLGWLQYRLWFGDGGQREVAALQEDVARQEAENAAWAAPGVTAVHNYLTVSAAA